MKYLIAVAITFSFLFAWDKSFSQEVTTGNLLPNANDGVDWNSSSTDQINSANSSGYVTNGSTVNGFDITCTNQSNCGYKYSVGGDFEVTGTATVSAEDIALTNNSINQSMLDNGVTLNSYIDVANCESTQGNCESKGGSNDSHTTTIVLKDSSGNVLSTTTQTRTEVTGFQGNCNGYPGTTTTGITTGCGQYTDRIIYLGVGSNKVDWSWSGTDSNYSNQSKQGPNLLGAKLTMTYNSTEYNPIDDEVIEDIEDIIEDIPEDFDWINEDITDLPDFFVPDEDFEIPFEDDFYFEEIVIDDFPSMEDFDMDVFEEMPDMEMVFFEEEFSEPLVVTEEIFTEEFEEDFTEFLEETGMEEEFMEFLEEEGITAEEFFEEITEEEFNDELTEESFDEFEEPMEEVATNEESVPEVIEDKEEPMEKSTETEPMEEEKEVASNESTEETEPSSEGTDESEVQAEDSGEQEEVQSEETGDVNTDTDVAETVAKVESKLKKNLKILAKQIAQVTKENTQNLSKEDLFFKNDSLDTYKKIAFYTAKDIYEGANMGLFIQMDLSPYTGDIYVGTNLSAYTNNDPIEINRVKLINIEKTKQKLLAELEILKQ
jgi:hypothetical protein